MLKFAFALLLLADNPATAQTTPVTEVNTAALTGPFDQSPGAHHLPHDQRPRRLLAAVAPARRYWCISRSGRDACQHLADLEICLTQGRLRGPRPSRPDVHLARQRTRLDSSFDLTGYRGMWTAHAFEATTVPRPGDLGYRLVPHSIAGTWSIADLASTAPSGDRATGLEVDEAGDIRGPRRAFRSGGRELLRARLAGADPTLAVWTVLERGGDFPHEIGPLRVPIAARARHVRLAGGTAEPSRRRGRVLRYVLVADPWAGQRDPRVRHARLERVPAPETRRGSSRRRPSSERRYLAVRLRGRPWGRSGRATLGAT